MPGTFHLNGCITARTRERNRASWPLGDRAWARVTGGGREGACAPVPGRYERFMGGMHRPALETTINGGAVAATRGTAWRRMGEPGGRTAVRTGWAALALAPAATAGGGGRGCRGYTLS